jgi:hypothetical protein
MCIVLHVKYQLLFQILVKLEFYGQTFEKKTQFSYFMKIRPVEAELFHADRQTRRLKDNSKFICYSRTLQYFII